MQNEFFYLSIVKNNNATSKKGVYDTPFLQFSMILYPIFLG